MSPAVVGFTVVWFAGMNRDFADKVGGLAGAGAALAAGSPREVGAGCV